MGFDFNSASYADDTWFGFLLWRYGEEKECAQYNDAVLLCPLFGQYFVGGLRLQPCLWTWKRILGWVAVGDVERRWT